VLGRRASTRSDEGLPDERKALAVRYTIDAAEAQTREQLAAEVRAEEAEKKKERRPAVPTQPRATAADDALGAPEPWAGRSLDARSPTVKNYVIQLSRIGFLWRWTVFDDIGVRTEDPLPPLSPDFLTVVAADTVPRLSERSAKCAAERAARRASRFEITHESRLMPRT
jgi:hypothetical protein